MNRLRSEKPMRWTVEQEKALLDMVKENVPIEEIAETLRRSVDAISMKAKRLGLPIPEKSLAKISEQKEVKTAATTTTNMKVLSPIKPAKDVISMKEMMLVLLGALEKLKSPRGLGNLELKRLRLIVSIARTYTSMLERYEEWTFFEQTLIDNQAWLLEIFKGKLQLEKDPAEKVKLESAIKHIENSLKETKEKYGYEPLKKKAKLVGYEHD